MATPFVQGRLRDEPLSVEVQTECVHCGQPLHLTLDRDMGCEVGEQDARPLVFQPHVDWTNFTGPNIIDVF